MTSKSLVLELQKSEAAKLEAALKECVSELERARKRMRIDQGEINRLKAETRAMLAQIKNA